MNKLESDRWKNFVVGEIFKAIVAYEPLRDALIFKGARILNLHLDTERQSLDIDSNFGIEFVQEHPNLDDRQAWIQSHIEPALRNYFESQEPVRFQIQNVTVMRNPPKVSHIRGWDALIIEVKVRDEKNPKIPNLPNVEIEIAAPEALGANAVTSIQLDGFTMKAYTLHRIAGEKLRAFLTSLPAYRGKRRGGSRVPRAKDLHDLARILDARPKDQLEFWREAADEFKLACESRDVDCIGIESFKESWEMTRRAYETDANLAAVPFQEADEALSVVVGLFKEFGVFPLEFQ